MSWAIRWARAARWRIARRLLRRLQAYAGSLQGAGDRGGRRRRRARNAHRRPPRGDALGDVDAVLYQRALGQ